MTEYIEREAAVKVFNNFDAGRADSPPFTLLTPEEFAEYLYELPTADVAPVVHGRWEDSTDDWLGTDVYTCSKCRESYVLVEGTPKENLWHYCPNCGAKMDGGDSDEVN